VADDEESRAIEALSKRLVTRFPHVSEETVNGVVAAAHQRFHNARIRDFVPLLVEHAAVNALRARRRRPAESLEQLSGPPMSAT
jgi:hypothetical protein